MNVKYSIIAFFSPTYSIEQAISRLHPELMYKSIEDAVNSSTMKFSQIITYMTLAEIREIG